MLVVLSFGVVGLDGDLAIGEPGNNSFNFESEMLCLASAVGLLSGDIGGDGAGDIPFVETNREFKRLDMS